MKIKTNRLLLIPCTVESYAALVGKYQMGSHIEKHLMDLKKDITFKGWGVWFVIHSTSNLVIGDAGFKGKPNNQKIVEIGYSIISDFQNNGFATEAVRGIIDWAFSSNQVDKIVAECAEENLASIKVLEKIGMIRTYSKDGIMYWECHVK